METRTELILLQRTMVVVEGVARSLNPSINIWRVAGPVVEDYIRTNLGPAAVARDLARSARMLTRFGPHLPALLESALIRLRQSEDPEPPRRSFLPALGYFLAGVGVSWGVFLFFLLLT
jgi:ubiquinone biosynthesis protein